MGRSPATTTLTNSPTGGAWSTISILPPGNPGVLLATHDLRIASQADRVISLRNGQIVKETVLQPGRSAREVLAELA